MRVGDNIQTRLFMNHNKIQKMDVQRLLDIEPKRKTLDLNYTERQFVFVSVEHVLR